MDRFTETLKASQIARINEAAILKAASIKFLEYESYIEEQSEKLSMDKEWQEQNMNDILQKLIEIVFAKNVQLAMENNKSKIESKQKLDTLSKMASTQSTSDDDDNDDD
jgi:hypothetical protein